MPNPKQIEIVVVTYHNDFDLLERLLQSIYMYWKKTEVSKIHVILNDTVAYSKEFNKVIKHNSHLDFPINKIYGYEYLDLKIKYFNWSTQQIFKILSGKFVNTDWYIINDCKDYYCEQVSINDIFNKDGKATIQMKHPVGTGSKFPSHEQISWSPGPFLPALINSFELFDLDPMDHRHCHFPTVTPFIVKTQIMNDMVSYLRNTTKGFFPFLFSAYVDGHFLLTEFLTYGAYCYKTTKYHDYVHWDSNHRAFYNKVKQSKDLRRVVSDV